MENKSLEQEKEIWLKFAVAFSQNNSSGIVYTTDKSMRRTGSTTIRNTIAKRADEMLKQYKERFYE